MMWFIRFLADVHAYMYPKKKFKRPPGQTISSYKMNSTVSEDERLLMLLNLARSPQAARQLMADYGVSSAAEVLERLPKKRRVSFKARLQQLLRRIDGHNTDDPYRVSSAMNNRNRL